MNSDKALDGSLQPPKVPTWLEPVPLSYRRKRGALALSIAIAVAVFLFWQQASGDSDIKSTLWAVAVLAVGVWRYRVWQRKETVRRFASVAIPLTSQQRLRKASPLLALGFIGAVLIWGLQWQLGALSDRWFVGLPFFGIGLAGVFVFTFFKTEHVLTKEATAWKEYYKAENAKDEEKRQQQHEDTFNYWCSKKIVRYTAAALLLFYAYQLATEVNAQWSLIVIVVLLAFIAAWDIVLWLLAACFFVGLAVLGFKSLAALPLSAAIIIGALIIAGSRSR